MLTEAYIGLGSNLGDRAANLEAALRLLLQASGHVTASSIYETTPVGFQNQPPFLNAVCRIWTSLDTFRLMAWLTEIETSVGRRRIFANAPRTLDMDILMYGRAVLRSPGLTIPHPRMASRAFVLAPLAELSPALRHPVLRQTVRSLLAGLPHGRDTLRIVSALPGRAPIA